MEVKVLTTEPVVEIDGVKYHHHPNGGGLVAETAKVAKTIYVGPYAVVKGPAWITGKNMSIGGMARISSYPQRSEEDDQLTWSSSMSQTVLREISEDIGLKLAISLDDVKSAVEYIRRCWFNETIEKETPGKLYRTSPALSTCVFLLFYAHLWLSGQKKSKTEDHFLRVFARGRAESKEPWRNLSKFVLQVVKSGNRKISVRMIQEEVAPRFWNWCVCNGIEWPDGLPSQFGPV